MEISNCSGKLRSAAEQVFLFRVASDENGRRKFGVLEYDQHIILGPGYGMEAGFVGNMVEFQGVSRNIYPKTAVCR